MKTHTAELDALSAARPAYQRGLRPWKPGQSGNPGGRPSLTEAMKLCRELTPDAVETLKKNLKHKNGNVANMAAKIILEQAWGRPTVMDLDDKVLPEFITDLIVQRVEMVIVRPEDRDAAREASPPRGDGADAHSTGASEAPLAVGGPGGHPGA